MWVSGQENVHTNRHKATKEVDEETNLGRNMSILPRKRGEAYFCDWSSGDEPRFQCFFESRHGSMLDKIQNGRGWSAIRFVVSLRLFLNSCPWKGIVGSGCAKMMTGSDTLQQYLSLLSLKERASINGESARKESLQVWRRRDQDVALVCSHSDEHWRTSVS